MLEAQGAGSEVFAIRAIAEQAHREIIANRDEFRQSQQPLERALANLQLIERLSQLPGVRSYLQATEKEIVIFGEGITWSRARLILSKGGMRLEHGAQIAAPEGWATKRKNLGETVWVRSLTADKAQLESLCPEYDMGKLTLRKIAALNPDTIYNKFRRVVLSPIKVS